MISYISNIAYDEHCSWNDSRSGEAIHALQEGQVIVGYEKIDSGTWEGSGFDTDVTPSKYSYNSYSKSIAEYKNKILDAEASGEGEEYKARLEQELNSLQEAASKLETSHSTFAIDWRCKGSGNAFDQKRGKVYASYKVRVMSLPSPQTIETYLASGFSAQKPASSVSSTWKKLPGSAKDVGDGWVIGTNVEGGGYGIYRWTGSTWQKIPGSAVRIGGNSTNPWVVNNSGLIYRWTGSTWQQMPGSAKDVDDGWVIGTDVEGGGYGIHRWTGSTWQKVPGGAVNIGGSSSEPWVVNDKDSIYQQQK